MPHHIGGIGSRIGGYAMKIAHCSGPPARESVGEMKCRHHDSLPKTRRPLKRPERVPLKPKVVQAPKRFARGVVRGGKLTGQREQSLFRLAPLRRSCRN
jgi:hypothetical protein